MTSRFVEVRENDEYLILDLQGPVPHVICRCKGWKAPLQAEYLCRALEAYHSALFSRLGMDTQDGPNLATRPARGVRTNTER